MKKSFISTICLMFSLSILIFQTFLDATLLNPKIVSTLNGSNICIGFSIVNDNVEIVAVNHAGEYEQSTTIISEDYSFQSDLEVLVDELGNVIVVWIGIDRDTRTLSLYSNTYLSQSERWTGTTQISHIGQNLYQGYSLSQGQGFVQISWSEYINNENAIICTSKFTNEIWEKATTYDF